MKNIELNCPFCGASHNVTVNPVAYAAWQGGMLIQKAMPKLSPTEREQLISGICPKCQKDFFGE